MLVHLKIKIKSLAAESRIIRSEERKWPGQSRERFSLHSHRVLDVRSEARDSLLAYGFLRKRRYRQLEPASQTAPNWANVERLVSKYGNVAKDKTKEELGRWAEGN